MPDRNPNNKRDAEVVNPAATKRRSALRRGVLGVAAFVILCMLVYAAPSLPFVQAWLLSQAQASLAAAGYRISFESSSGNVWNSIVLDSTRIESEGLDIAVNRLKLGYRLPELARGRLPLTVSADGVSGNVSPGEISAPAPSDARAIELDLRQVEITSVSLAIDDIPYTIPDFQVRELDVRHVGDRLGFSTTVATSQGRAELKGHVDLAPFGLEARIVAADAALARHWFDGVSGGTVTGVVRVNEGRIGAKLELAQGALEFLDMAVENVSGTATYDHPSIEASLHGRALEGPVTATGTVDVSAQHWQVLVAGQPALQESAKWLAQDRLPVPLEQLELDGAAVVSLSASGWGDVALSGQATGTGTLLGEPFEIDEVDFTFATADGVGVTAAAHFAGNPGHFALRPVEGGSELSFVASSWQLYGLTIDAALAAASVGGQLSGNGTVMLRGEALGRATEATANLELEADGARIALSGTDGLGASLAGAAFVTDAGAVGTLSLRNADLTVFERPADLLVGFGGNWTDVEIEAALTSADPLIAATGDLRLDNDFRGNAFARIENGSVASVRGTLGKLAFAGEGDLRALAGELAFELTETDVAGAVTGSFGVEGGVVRYQKDVWSATGALRGKEATFMGLEIPELTGTLELSHDKQIDASFSGAGLSAEVDDGTFHVAFDDFPLWYLEHPLTLTGSAEVDLALGIAGISADMTARHPHGRARVSGDFAALNVSVELAPGFAVGPLSLNEQAEFSGTIWSEQRRAQASGTLGSVDATANLRLDDGGAIGAVSLSDDSGTAELRLHDQAWQLSGQMGLTSLGAVFGLPALQGSVATDLAGGPEGYSGALRASEPLFGAPLYVTLEGLGDVLELRAQTRQMGETLRFVGSLMPDIAGKLDLGGLGSVAVAGAGVDSLVAGGQGSVPTFAWGDAQVGAQPWSLEADMASRSAELKLGNSRLSVAWAEVLTASFAIDQTVHYQDGSLRAVVAGRVGPGLDDGWVDGELALATANHHASLPLSGNWQGIDISGQVPAAMIHDLLGFDQDIARLEGRLDLIGRVEPDAQRVELAGKWQEHALSVQGDRGGIRAQLSGDRLTVLVTPTELSIEADLFPLATITASDSLLHDATLDGNLEATSLQELESIWEGELRLASSDYGVLTLLGRHTSLQALAELSAWGAHVRAQGPLLPELEVALSASLPEYRLELVGQLHGVLLEPTFSGDLHVGAWDFPDLQLSTTPQQLSLQASLAQGPNIVVRGEQTDAAWSGGEWQGTVKLPLSLMDVAHELVVTPEGSDLLPNVAGEVSGPYLSGNMDMERGEVRAAFWLDAAPWLPRYVKSFTAEAHLAGQFDAWKLAVAGKGEILLSDVRWPVELGAAINGSGRHLDAVGEVTVAEQPVQIELSGAIPTLAGSIELSDVDVAPFTAVLPVGVSGLVHGRVDVALEPAFGVSGRLAAELELFGEQLVFSLEADGDDGAVLAGTLGTATFSARGPIDGRGTYALRVADSVRDLELHGTVDAKETVDFDVSGSFQGRPIEIAGRLPLEEGPAELNGRILEASIDVLFDGEALSGRLHAPAGTLSQLPMHAELEGHLQDGGLKLESLTFTGEAAGEPLDARIAGAIGADVDLHGAVTSGLVDVPLQVSFASSPGGYLWKLAGAGLVASGELSPSLRPTRLALYGSGQVAVHQARVSSDLEWTAGQGFAGNASATVAPAPDVKVDIELAGSSELAVVASVGARDLPLGNAAFTIPADPFVDPSLSGTMLLEGTAASWVAGWPGDDLQLTAALSIGGTLFEPSANGKVALSGALEAAGDVSASLGGAELNLTGSGLKVEGVADFAGYRLSADARDLDIADVLPQIAQPTLSFVVTARQSWGAAPLLAVDDLELRSAASRLSGSAVISERIDAALDIDGSIGDITVWTDSVEGRVAGPLAIRGVRDEPLLLTGELTATALRAPAADWSLEGSAWLSGTSSNPSLSVELSGAGTAAGTLRATLEPVAGRYQVDSDLSLADVTSRISIDFSGGTGSASGSVAWRDFAADVTAEGANVNLHGAGSLEGWSAYADTALATAGLRGELDALLEGLSGSVELTLAPLEAEWLSGEIRDINYQHLRIGTVHVAGQDGAAGRRLTLFGDRVDADVELGAFEPKWALTRLALPVTNGIEAVLAGAGDLYAGQLVGELTGRLGDQPMVLPVTMEYQDDAIQARADGRLLGGNVHLAAAFDRSAGWSGTVRADDLGFYGAQAGFTGDIHGEELGSPQMEGALEARHTNFTSRGTALVSPSTVVIEQTVYSELLVEPLKVQGRILPDFHFRLASAGRSFELSLDNDLLSASGGISLGSANTRLAIETVNAPDLAQVTLTAGLPDLQLKLLVPQESVADLWRKAEEGGLVFSGAGALRGELALAFDEGISLLVDGLAYDTPAGTLSAAGRVDLAERLHGRIEGSWRGSAGATTDFLPWLSTLEEAPFTLSLDDHGVRLDSESALGTLQAAFDTAKGRFDVQASLKAGEGSISVEAAVAQGDGPSGDIVLEGVPVVAVRLPTGFQSLALDALVELGSGGLEGSGRLSSPDGSLNLQGELGWSTLIPEPLLSGYFPLASEGTSLAADLDSFDLSDLPPIKRLAPHLRAPLSGTAWLRDGAAFARIASPHLSVAGEPLPLAIEISGGLVGVEVQGELGQSRFELQLSGEELSGLMHFANFPLQTIAEALVGDIATDAEFTGVGRVEVPFDRPQDSVIRVASERLRLERNGIVSTGDVAVTYQQGELTIDKAEFVGAGSWSAAGVFGPGNLDLRIDAYDADFGPLLSLLPPLAALDFGAHGSFSLRASGSPAAAELELTSPHLRVAAAGVELVAVDTNLNVRQGALTSDSRLELLTPLGGELVVRGQGSVSLLPLTTANLAVELAGALDIPVLGQLADVTGHLSISEEGVWQVDARAVMGRELRLTGTLNPLDLHLAGSGLDVRAPDYFLAGSDTDVDLRLVHDEDFVVSGDIHARSARLALGGREVRTGNGQRQAGSGLDRIKFDDVRIRAPQQVRFQESIGSAEVGADVDLTGTAARPQLAGTARAIRGTFAFAGRDFRIQSGEAVFDPGEGLYPSIAIRATATFEKARARASVADRVEFVAPRDGTTFVVILDIEGEFVDDGQGGRKLELTPALSSDALIQVAAPRADGAAAPARPLSEEELVALLTVGRLDLGGELIGQDGVAGGVAQTALDTALDLLVLGELQSVLTEALGLDLFEIRTTSLGALLDADNGGQFGVSLRLGAYLSEDVFASFVIGREGAAEGGFSLANRFSLRYDLAAVNLTVTGGLDFLTESLYPIPELGLSLGYAVTPLASFEAGLHLGGTRQSFGFGIGFRW